MILVIGGDSRLAVELISTVGEDQVIATTRRENRPNRVFLDLSDITDFNIPNGIKSAVILGGITTFDGCSDNYNYAFNVNCLSIPALIEKLLAAGLFTCFVSSNSVFMNTDGTPSESETPCPSPGFDYANMKYEAERRVMEIAKNLRKENLLSILRITKNVDKDAKPFCDWINNLSNGTKIVAFSDLYFAPIRYSDSANAIIKILGGMKHGIFHVSGIKDISYSDFAVNFVNYLGLDEKLVHPVLSSDIGVNLVYNHYITALNMKSTKEKLGIKETQLEKVYDYLSDGFRNKVKVSL